MPPKRRSDANETAESSKKTKTASAASTNPSNETRWSTKDDRWSAVSNSRNADADYKIAMADPEFAFTYVCRCPFGTKHASQVDDDDDDEDDDENEGDKGTSKPKCDGGKTCLCNKLAADHPDAPYVVTRAGYRKLMNQQTNCQVRDPDTFGMYTFNDHMAYGILQVIQNLILDFEEANKNWREQWVVCEALSPFIWYLSGSEFTMIDDAETADKTAKLIGTIFLSMLARLEREDMLKPDSEVKDLGIVMAGFIKIAKVFRDSDLMEDDTKTRKSKKRPFPFVPSKFDEYIAAYAKKYNIKLAGVPDIDNLVKDLNDEVELPTAKDHGDDPWGLEAALEEYKSECNCCGFFVQSKRSEIGGDSLDLTSWTSAQRKKAAFDKKEPLPKEILKGLKDGLVIGLG
ncbi:uncharacterized protein CTRU02_201548 [Colletotrichum truncatum]|uniref:Uncharacterized protein n=1 Tax=Colletotrichum truncatum TaxID=5467 RepID=A0ACC3ZHP9_COLTU|nr:uncharacterized protein CTRU02_10776 [Colletotrichum truncatum]KAF6786652.1 hypothetical protein CTRU02_10776 [Colletotrichum truncatum]